MFNTYYLKDGTLFDNDVLLNLRKIIQCNWETAKESKIQHHVVTWSQIKFLSDSKSFANIILATKHKDYATDECKLMKDVIGNNLNEIVKFLIDCYVNIILLFPRVIFIWQQ